VPRLIMMRFVSVSPRSMRPLSIMPFTTRFLTRGPLTSRPVPPRSSILSLHTAILIAVLFILSLDCAFIILLIRINRMLSSMNPVSLFLFTPFNAFSFLLTTSGFGCSEPSVEFLILLPEDLHRFRHRLQGFYQF
jgi:hypothetical protein